MVSPKMIAQLSVQSSRLHNTHVMLSWSLSFKLVNFHLPVSDVWKQTIDNFIRHSQSTIYCFRWIHHAVSYSIEVARILETFRFLPKSQIRRGHCCQHTRCCCWLFVCEHTSHSQLEHRSNSDQIGWVALPRNLMAQRPGWGSGGPRFQSHPILTLQPCSRYQLNQLGSKAALESTFKKSNTCGASNTRLYFFILQFIWRQKWMRYVEFSLNHTNRTGSLTLGRPR